MLIGQTSPVVVPTVRGISVQINRKFIKTQLLPDSDSQEICNLIQVKRESCSPLISQAECLLIPFSNYSAAGSFVDGMHVVSGSNLKYPTARGGWDVVSGTETRGDRHRSTPSDSGGGSQPSASAARWGDGSCLCSASLCWRTSSGCSVKSKALTSFDHWGFFYTFRLD